MVAVFAVYTAKKYTAPALVYIEWNLNGQFDHDGSAFKNDVEPYGTQGYPKTQNKILG